MYGFYVCVDAISEAAARSPPGVMYNAHRKEAHRKEGGRLRTYRTSEVARLIGIHPNTVRLYEELKLIPPVGRAPNRYRVFTDFHIDQFRLARLAFQVEVLQNGLRKMIVEMVKTSAAGDFDEALRLAEEYRSNVLREHRNAEEAIEIVRRLLSGNPGRSNGQDINAGAAGADNTSNAGGAGSTRVPGRAGGTGKAIGADTPILLKRKEVSELLQLSMDTLRNWEMNGLLTVKRRENGYRVYTDDDIRRLKMIRSLRCANYSLEAIRRMLQELSRDPETNIEAALNTPKSDDDIISVCDRLIVSLRKAAQNALAMQEMLENMKRSYG